MSDDAITRLERQGKTTLKIDGEIKKEISQLTEIIDIEIPKGLGTHTIRIE